MFCETRWLESASVASRAIVIWPNIVKYVQATEQLPKSKRPGCDSYKVVARATADKTIVAKLHTFVHAANIFTDF